MLAEVEDERLMEGKRVRESLKLLKANKESKGIEFVLEKSEIRLNSVKAFKLDRYFLPNEVPVDRLNTNLSKLNTKLEEWVSENQDCYRKIRGPQLVIRFLGGKYGNHYLLEPINGSQVSVKSRNAKLLEFKALRKVWRYMTRPFMSGRNGR